MKNNKLSQKDRVIEFIKQTGSVTRIEALTELGIFELSARIVDLEKEGFEFIKTPYTIKNKYGESVRMISYSLEKEN